MESVTLLARPISIMTQTSWNAIPAKPTLECVTSALEVFLNNLAAARQDMLLTIQVCSARRPAPPLNTTPLRLMIA
jgi:hypothetical protein